jgi:hypothetical protein
MFHRFEHGPEHSSGCPKILIAISSASVKNRNYRDQEQNRPESLLSMHVGRIFTTNEIVMRTCRHHFVQLCRFIPKRTVVNVKSPFQSNIPFSKGHRLTTSRSNPTLDRRPAFPGPNFLSLTLMAKEPFAVFLKRCAPGI